MTVKWKFIIHCNVCFLQHLNLVNSSNKLIFQIIIIKNLWLQFFNINHFNVIQSMDFVCLWIFQQENFLPIYYWLNFSIVFNYVWNVYLNILKCYKFCLFDVSSSIILYTTYLTFQTQSVFIRIVGLRQKFGKFCQKINKLYKTWHCQKYCFNEPSYHQWFITWNWEAMAGLAWWPIHKYYGISLFIGIYFILKENICPRQLFASGTIGFSCSSLTINTAVWFI